MNIAFCHESALPERGGCETYMADLARRLLADGHEVHLYTCRHDENALPAGIHYHLLPPLGGFRFLRPWRFGRRCLKALAGARHDVTVGFDKIWGLDILYPLGGLHSASAAHNILKHPGKLTRGVVRLLKACDLAHHSYLRLERRQYLSGETSQVLVNSNLVREHFLEYLGITPDRIRVIHSAIDPDRFPLRDCLRRRVEGRQRWQLTPSDVVALFVARNHRLKGLAPLLIAVRRLLDRPELRRNAPSFRLLVCGSDRLRACERQAQRLGIAEHVRFAGSCPDVHTAYFASDFLVHPTFYDPCSLVVLEAMSCGLPVITSRHNGASELLHPPHEGLVIDDPHHHDHLAWCLAQMLDPVRRRACSQAARGAASRWTFEHHYRQLLQAFQEVAQRKMAA